MSVLIIIFITAIVALFSGVFEKSKYARYISILGLLIALWASFQPDGPFFDRYLPMYEYSSNTALFTKISIIITILIFFLGHLAFINHRSHQAELYALMLLSLCGSIVLFGFQNLTTLFLGVEILSIPLYVMAGSNKTNLNSVEASLKYYLMGAFATGFLLFGISLIYGSTLTFDIYKIHQFGIDHPDNTFFILGTILILCALAFKCSLAPFHMWSPDVYQGAPSIITTFMATIVKISAFYALFKLMTICFAGVLPTWIQILGVFIIITLIIANLMGLVQTNAKRMLAYSSVSHAGYIAMIFFGITSMSIQSLAFYLFAYSIATVGVFTSLIWVEKVKGENNFTSFRGLYKKEPLLAVVATISLLSMAGVPLTAGFIGKFYIFSQAMISAPFLVVIAVIGSAISIAYYLRLIIAMFFYNQSTFENIGRAPLAYKIIAIVVIITIIAIGVYPDLFILQFGL